MYPPLPGVNIVTGNIISLNGNTLTVKANNIISDPVVNGMDSTRTITVNASTTINLIQNRTPEETKALKPGKMTASSTAEILTPIKLEKISVSDLKAGDLLSIVVKEDAQTVQNLTATMINVIPKITSPEIPMVIPATTTK